MEKTNLIIIRASDLLMQISKDPSSDGILTERLLIQPACLTLIASLLATNQVAVLVDFADPDFIEWSKKLLLEELKLQVDAIYSFN